MKLQFEGAKEQWDEIFTEEMMDTTQLDAHTANAEQPSIRGSVKQDYEEKFNRYQKEGTLLKVTGENIFGDPYVFTGRIEKVNYNMTLMLLHKEEGEYALIDIMLTREISPLHTK